MSHDELMVKINQRYWKMFNHNSQDQTEVGIEHRTLIQNQYFALRAIVELHSPIITEDDGLESCYCISNPSDSHWDLPYPCPTIRAIEKELG